MLLKDFIIGASFFSPWEKKYLKQPYPSKFLFLIWVNFNMLKGLHHWQQKPLQVSTMQTLKVFRGE